MPTRAKTHRVNVPGTKHRKRVADVRASAAVRGYGRRWQVIRRAFLQRRPICEMCGGPATEVHHIQPLAAGGGCEDDNLMALCKRCHNRIEGRGAKILADARR
jgi:5-methylcytosine-specific restriction endonuclease McrA